MNTIRQFIGVVVLFAFSISASALTFMQSPIDGGDGSLSVKSAGAQIADNFQFATNVTLTNISWWGSYDPNAPASESLTARIFADNGAGAPAVNPLLETVFAGTGDDSDGLFDLFGGTVFRYDVSVNQLLQGGVNYFLSVFNNDDAQDWYWLESAAGENTGWSRAADSDAWSLDDPALNMSFQLTADPIDTPMPIPGTLFLMLLPLLWLGRASS